VRSLLDGEGQKKNKMIRVPKLFRPWMISALEQCGYNVQKHAYRYTYEIDGLGTAHDSSFMVDEDFIYAYSWTKDLIGKDYKWYYRNYIGMKLSEYAASISPNFVECGVGECWMTLSILKYFEKKDIEMPTFTLFDTFSGIAEDYVSSEEEETWNQSTKDRKKLYDGVYGSTVDLIFDRLQKTACPKEKVTIIEGAIPDTFTDDVIQKLENDGPISYLHIDMNNAVPEVAAMEALYPMVAPGGVILLDDYAYYGYTYQKNAIDKWCLDHGLPNPISLPTGQGLLIKRA